ncbi:hypothetical protein AB1Y20_001238 [Prymnesium parvum]|uniref:Exportin-4 n=1 Tax=Prymnesium parvum TaxID=97485 RepID=A0AB34K8Z1_PRYPA
MEALAQLEQACHAFLQAQSQEQRSAAEATLMSFRTMSRPVAMCQHILQHSSLPYAQLFVLTTLREGLGREWAELSQPQRDAMQQQLLDMLMRAHGLEPYVCGAVLQLLAVHAKHDALNPTGNDGATKAIMRQAQQLVHSPDVARKPLAAQLLLALVHEFGAPTGGVASGGLSWASHARARTRFQLYHLLDVFRLGLHQLESLSHACAAFASPGVPSLNAEQLEWLRQTLLLLTTTLSWDFDGLAEAMSVQGSADGEARPGLNATVVRPPHDDSGWKQLLSGHGLAACVMGLAEALSQSQSEGAHEVRQLLIQLASVSPRIFNGGQAHAEYIQLLLQAAAHLLGSDGCQRQAAEFVDGATMLQRLVCSGGLEVLLLLSADHFAALLQLLQHATVASLHASLTRDANGDTPVQAEAYDVLMESWVSILTGMREARRTDVAHVKDAVLQLEMAAWRVYEASAQAKLQAAARLAAALASDEIVDEGEEDDTDEERHNALAVLGRARLSEAVALLAGAVDERAARLRAFCEHAITSASSGSAHGTGDAGLEALLEELDLLVQFVAHLAADKSEGADCPAPPVEIASHASARPEDQPAHVLLERIVQLLQLQLHALLAAPHPSASPLAAALSPALGLRLLWSLRRFTCTYLMPDEASASVLSPPLLQLWGRDTPGGQALLSLSVEAAIRYLERWSSEPELTLESASLLADLARLRSPRPGPAMLLASLPSWGRLLCLPPRSVQPRAERLLSEACCRAATSLPDSSQRQTALRDVCTPLLERLRALLGAQSLAQPNAIHEARAVCSCLRGLVCATSPLSASLLLEMVGWCLPALASMLEVYAPAQEQNSLPATIPLHRDGSHRYL